MAQAGIVFQILYCFSQVFVRHAVVSTEFKTTSKFEDRSLERRLQIAAFSAALSKLVRDASLLKSSYPRLPKKFMFASRFLFDEVEFAIRTKYDHVAGSDKISDKASVHYSPYLSLDKSVEQLTVFQGALMTMQFGYSPFDVNYPFSTTSCGKLGTPVA